MDANGSTLLDTNCRAYSCAPRAYPYVHSSGRSNRDFVVRIIFASHLLQIPAGRYNLDDLTLPMLR